MDIVWVNGTFDILHVGHIELLKYAKSLGDFLCVGIDCDKRVTENKGNDRPINNECDRMTMLYALRYVDMVIIFDSDDTLTNCIKYLKPKHMVVGSDYKNSKVIGAEHAAELHFFERIKPHSSTNIINKKK